MSKNTTFTEIEYIENKDTKIVGHIGYDSERNWILASWRGTSNKVNVFEDLDFSKSDYPHCRGCQVHEGFYYAYKSVHGRALSKVKSLMEKYPDARIMITGHSLGGGLATLCAL